MKIIRQMGIVLMGIGAISTGGCQTDEGDRATEQRVSLGEDAESLSLLTVYKNPTCGCCTEWVKHVEENGFSVEIHDMGFEIMQIKNAHRIPPEATSCHTTVVGDYAFEGHVPADLIAQVLRERPDIKGQIGRGVV